MITFIIVVDYSVLVFSFKRYFYVEEIGTKNALVICPKSDMTSSRHDIPRDGSQIFDLPRMPFFPFFTARASISLISHTGKREGKTRSIFQELFGCPALEFLPGIL
jgi:hypothetical protein